ncbi:MAG: YopX family protein [Oscillospiraceae bacterium]|nr:YopX family protein [Oscillospiraceae bacterium]
MNKLHRLWRGKRKDTLEWAVLDLAEVAAKKGYIGFAVSLETLGQCVGFTDRNRKPIFEGDIAIYHGPSGKTCKGKIVYSGNKSRFVMLTSGGQTFAVERKYANCYEVVGNIHDVPQQTEGTEKSRAD